MEVTPEEEEREKCQRIAGEERRDRGPLPEPNEPPRGDGRGDRDLDRRERKVRLPVGNQSEREQDRREAHPRDRVRPCGAAGVVADDVVPERAEVVHEKRHERREEEKRGGPRRHEGRDGLPQRARLFRRDQIHSDEWQEDERVELGGTRCCERERRHRATLPHEEGEAREEEQQYEEVVPPLHDEGKELWVECDRRGHREALGGAPHEERDERERADVRRKVEIALVPDEAEMVEEPHERRAHQEHEGEIGEVVQRRVVDHRPEEHRRVQVISDVRVHAGEELPRSLLDHEGAVVDVRVRLPGLAEDDRRERGNDHERRDDRRDVRDAGARRE